MICKFDSERHEYTMDGYIVPSVTEAIKALRDFSMVPPDVLENKRELGVELHFQIETFQETGEFFERISPDVVPYCAAYRSFRQQVIYTVTGFETQFYSQKFPRFAGTPDEWGFLNDRPTIIDSKSTYSIDATVGIQLAGYRELIGQHDGRFIDADRYALQLKKDGQFRLMPFEDATDRGVFLSCLNLLNWKNAHNLG